MNGVGVSQSIVKNFPRTVRQRGSTLVEALIALTIMAFGTLALASMQSKLSRNSDISKQRTEAVRLGQEKLENLRSYTTISSNGRGTAWNDMPVGGMILSDRIAPGDKYSDGAAVVGNTVFDRSWWMAGNASDAMRVATVTVTWSDRGAKSTAASEKQSISLSTIISKTDPVHVGSLGFPLPGNTNLKRPKNRNLNIPIPAVALSEGKSAYQLNNQLAVIFNNESGYVVQKCGFIVTASSDVSGCAMYNAYIVAGYVSRIDNNTAWPTGMNTSGLDGGQSGAITCTYGQAVNQNTTATALNDYKYYLCVVPVASGGSWSGKMLLGGISTTGSTIVCRFQYPTDGSSDANERNVQAYVAVNKSLDAQNYVLTTSSAIGNAACPVADGLSTVLHQDCRSIANYSANTAAILASNCPAATPM